MHCGICKGEHETNACPRSYKELNRLPFLWHKEFHWVQPGENNIASPIKFTIGENDANYIVFI